MTTKTAISVAKEYSDEPAGRYPSDGSFSGERFRKELLVPALKGHEHVTVDFDGTEGYGSSFLEEAFGGLVRDGFAPAQLRKQLEIHSKEDPTVIEEIWGYIDEAAQQAKAR